MCLSLHLGACVCCALCGVCVHYVVWGALRLLLAIKRNDVQISQESDYRVCVCMCACICVCACVYALWCGGCRDPCQPLNVMTCRSVRKQCIGCVCVCVCVRMVMMVVCCAVEVLQVKPSLLQEEERRLNPADPHTQDCMKC